MGTNYYAIPKVTPEIKQKIIHAIETDDFFAAKNMIPTSVHIGKSSFGWQFCFNHNDWQYFDKTLESFEKFILESTIEDEYGTPISTDDFWQLVNVKKDGLDGKEYYTNWAKHNKDFATGKPLPPPSYIPHNYGQETHFGLYFSDCTEFS